MDGATRFRVVPGTAIQASNEAAATDGARLSRDRELLQGAWLTAALMHHSNQGMQYTSGHFQDLLKEQGITCSMSRAGEVWDNSALETFFSSMKTEHVAHKVYRTREEARSDVFDYIQRFYNRLGDTRRWATSARHSLKRLEKLRSVSTEPAAAQMQRSKPSLSGSDASTLELRADGSHNVHARSPSHGQSTRGAHVEPTRREAAEFAVDWRLLGNGSASGPAAERLKDPECLASGPA
jgi:hypothetical protein